MTVADLSWMRPGERVLVLNGDATPDHAVVRSIHERGTKRELAPHARVDIVGGDRDVVVDLARIHPLTRPKLL